MSQSHDKEVAVGYLTAFIEVLEERYKAEVAPLEEQINAVREKWEPQIKSLKASLEAIETLPDIFVPATAEWATKVSQAHAPEDYPRDEATGVKVLWALEHLGGGPIRLFKIVEQIQEFDPRLTRGAINTAMSRLVQKKRVAKDAEGKYPLFQLANSQVESPQEHVSLFEKAEEATAPVVDSPRTPGHVASNNGSAYEAKPWDYPDTWAKKIPYAIAAYDRFIHRSEIETFLRRFENISSNSLSYAVSTLYKNGGLFRIKFNNASHLICYGLPHMIGRGEGGKMTVADPKYDPDMSIPALKGADPQTFKIEVEMSV